MNQNKVDRINESFNLASDTVPDSTEWANAASKRQIHTDICVSTDITTLREIRLLRKCEYKKIYPKMDLDNDSLDNSAIILYTRNKKGQITSTARLAFGPDGFCEEEYLREYRKQGKRLMEFGRFVIKKGNGPLLRAYYSSILTLASNLRYDAIVMAMQPRHIEFHRRVVGVKVVEPDMGITFGGPCRLACVVWEIEATKPIFFKWLGGGAK
jgi:hypothetical protein